MKNHLFNKNCLFFGMKNCEKSIKAKNFLKKKGLKVLSIDNINKKQKLPKKVFNWCGDYIFSYRNHFILPQKILNNAKYLAINIHPGTEEFPGSGSYSWAIYKKKKEFGTTIHIMDEKCDHGKILNIYKFKIDSKMTAEQLMKKSYNFTYTSFKKFINEFQKLDLDEIKKLKKNKSKIKWIGRTNTLKQLNKMRKINLNMNAKEIKLRLKAFNFKDYPITIFD